MFKCVQCPSVFGRKDSLDRHEITHTSIRFPCTVCPSTFSQKSNLNRHLKNVHGIVYVPTHLRPIPAAEMVQPSITTPQIFVPDVPTTGGSNVISEDDILCVINEDNDTDSYRAAVNGLFTQPRIVRPAPLQGDIQIAPNIFVPDVPARESHIISDDEMCLAAMEEFERAEEVHNSNTVFKINMAGPIKKKAKIYKKTLKFTPPPPPVNLIDCSNITIDFTARKCINIGLDPTDEFKTVVHIITASCYVNIPVDFLQSIFKLMGNILSSVLDRSEKYKRNLILETESISMSSMVYKSENTLVLESKIQEGCRVFLNRTNLLVLKDLEYTIYEIINRKSIIIKPIVMQQIDLIASFLKSNVALQNSTPEMRTRSRNIDNDYLSIHVIGENNYNFINQLKLYATESIIQKWMDKVKKDEGYNDECPMSFSPQSLVSLHPQGNLTSVLPLSPPTQESFIENNKEGCSENDGPFGQQYN